MEQIYSNKKASGSNPTNISGRSERLQKSVSVPILLWGTQEIMQCNIAKIFLKTNCPTIMFVKILVSDVNITICCYQHIIIYLGKYNPLPKAPFSCHSFALLISNGMAQHPSLYKTLKKIAFNRH